MCYIYLTPLSEFPPHSPRPGPSPLFLCVSRLFRFISLSPALWIIIYNICGGEEEGERGGVLNHQTPQHMKAAPSSGPHYGHTDIWDIFFRFSNNRAFDLWTGIRISLQKSYRWKDNREWDICPQRERENEFILTYRSRFAVLWDLFCSESGRSIREFGVRDQLSSP